MSRKTVILHNKMKKLLLLFVCILSVATISAQEKIAVFVYSTTKLNQPTNALRANIEEALNNSDEKAYIVVDRTEEFNEILKKEFKYQEEGYVSNKQLVTAGEQLGATKVCGVVIVDYGKEGYFIECKILDVKKNQIDKIAKYPTNDEQVNNLGIATSKRVANSLALQLNVRSIDQENQENWKNEHGNYIAWSIAGTGYPWNLTDGIEFRMGGIVGIGLYCDLGADFMRITVNNGHAYTTKTMFRYAGGVKFYFYKGLFLACGYGTISQPADAVTYDYGYYFLDVERAIVRQMASESSRGLLFHTGYNLVTTHDSDAGFFLGLSAGASYDIKNNVMAPSFLLKIGVAWNINR